MTPPEPGPAVHVFSVDLEEWFQVSVFDDVVPRDEWEQMPSRVERSALELLELLARHEATATWFTLGWLAERKPGLVRTIRDAGHEIASHGHGHRRVGPLGPDGFREDLRRSKDALEQATGTAVRGFRAPSFSIRPGDEWAFDVLLEEGFVYDSSLFPIRRPDYGYPSAPPAPHEIRRPGGTLLELPLATTRWAGLRLPAAGGAYFRQLPYALVRRAFGRKGERGEPGMFYIHPWELDPGQPRLPASRIGRLRHYRRLDRTVPRLERLLREFRFESVERRFDLGDGSAREPAGERGPSGRRASAGSRTA